MINRIMADVNVKLGIKHILERIEAAYLRKSPVRMKIKHSSLKNFKSKSSILLI